MSLHQTVPDELHALAPQGAGTASVPGTQLLPVHILRAGQVGTVESQGGKQQPGVVVDVRLDEPLPVADPDGHHRMGCDAVGGQVAAKARHDYGRLCEGSKRTGPQGRVRGLHWAR